MNWSKNLAHLTMNHDSIVDICQEAVQEVFKNIATDILNETGVVGRFTSGGPEAVAWPFKRLVFCPEPTNSHKLFILALAAAHVELTSTNEEPSHLMALKATKLAKRRMHSYNLAYSIESTHFAQAHIAQAIYEDVTHGVQVVDEEAFGLAEDIYLECFDPFGLPPGVESGEVSGILSDHVRESIFISWPN